MPFKFFVIPMADSGGVEAELNSFVQSHRVLSVERHWVNQGAASCWALCVDYLDRPAAARVESGRTPPRSKVDYREVLSPEQFSLFAKLRDLRKTIAQADAIPVYTVFTNEQLAEMVRSSAVTKADLENIAGVGDARVAKFGDRFLEFLIVNRPSTQ